MTLPSSGNPISFSQIESEFGGNPTNSFGGYRMSTPETYGGKTFTELDTGIPTSGTINYGSFSGKQVHVVVDCHSGSSENRVNARTDKYDNNNIDNVGEEILNSPKAVRKTDTSGSRLWVRVNKSFGSATGNVNNCALRTGSWNAGTTFTIEIGSSGGIYGAGGDGGHGGTGESSGCGSGNRDGCNGGDGTSGLGIEYYGSELINDGTISTGYGGGGGGGFRKVEREEFFSGPTYSASGGGGGGGQGLPGGSAGGGAGSATSGTTTAGGNGGNGGEEEQAHGGGGGGGGSNGSAGEGGNNNDGTAGTTSSGGNGASGTHTGSIENENNVTGGGGTGGGIGAAIRKTSGIVFNITNNGTITGSQNATGVA
tara:strand:+ start:39 stop:1145 length:1107 start_codon:yes stop_codon:yes gene_type:complete